MSRSLMAPRAWQAQSLLLAYPDEDLVACLPVVERVIATLPAPVGDPLAQFVAHVRNSSLSRLAADYVETFDHRKRCCLYLTYYAYGDTRKRGVAMLKLKQTFRAAGLQITDSELPDHLAVVLEFAGTGDPDAGYRLLLEHRAGLELLRLALADAQSPWAAVLASISATLPPLGKDERQAVARLAAEGPPEEQVGLAPFAPPEYLPQPAGGAR